MTYFEDKKNIEIYIKMAEGYDGRALIELLKTYLVPDSRVLELGMGPGVDFEILSESFQATGSDYSEAFVNRYLNAHPEADVLVLDAIKMDIDRSFDGIYSNKVLQHLTREQVVESIHNQLAVLPSGGIMFHSLWYGDHEEEHHGLLFIYYTEATFARLLGDGVEILASDRYTELEIDDSIYFVLKKK